MFFIFCLSPTLFGLGAVAMAGANRHVPARTRRNRWVKFWSYFTVVHIVALTILAGSKTFAGLIIVVIVLGGLELHSVCRRRLLPRPDFAQGQPLYSASQRASYIFPYLWLCALGFATLKFALTVSTQEVIFVYLLVAAMDGFSQLTGQLFGRHKIAPNISPNKTVEGTLGGISATVLLGIGLHWMVNISPVLAAIYAICIALAAFVGDLTASFVKRVNGVKDFGNLLPGQGGILDRFDSLLMAASVYWISSQFIFG